MAHLFEPFTLRGVTLRNRIGVSPMCMYSYERRLFQRLAGGPPGLARSRRGRPDYRRSHRGRSARADHPG